MQHEPNPHPPAPMIWLGLVMLAISAVAGLLGLAMVAGMMGAIQPYTGDDVTQIVGAFLLVVAVAALLVAIYTLGLSPLRDDRR